MAQALSANAEMSTPLSQSRGYEELRESSSTANRGINGACSHMLETNSTTQWGSATTTTKAAVMPSPFPFQEGHSSGYIGIVTESPPPLKRCQWRSPSVHWDLVASLKGFSDTPIASFDDGRTSVATMAYHCPCFGGGFKRSNGWGYLVDHLEESKDPNQRNRPKKDSLSARKTKYRREVYNMTLKPTWYHSLKDSLAPEASFLSTFIELIANVRGPLEA
ncbi:hypothetical protein L218DRAFT_991688 [Marasmius fiardii PR-910]|nr:hypothetical protein L218DRAFT_991688 [Marasmius fiardii PR-910]